MSNAEYVTATVTPPAQVTPPRLVLLFDGGHRLIQNGHVGLEGNVVHWNTAVLDALLEQALPWSGVFIASIGLPIDVCNRLDHQTLTEERYKNKISQIIFHYKATGQQPTVHISKIGATLHLFTTNFVKDVLGGGPDRTGNAGLQAAWSSMLKTVAEMDLFAPNRLSVSLALGIGIGSCFDEIVFVDFSSGDEQSYEFSLTSLVRR